MGLAEGSGRMVGIVGIGVTIPEPQSLISGC